MIRLESLIRQLGITLLLFRLILIMLLLIIIKESHLIERETLMKLLKVLVKLLN